MRRFVIAGLTLALMSLSVRRAEAEEPEAPEPSAPAASPPPEEDSEPLEVRPPDDPRRKNDVTPHPTTPPTPERNKFIIDPVGDGGVLLFGLSFSALSSALLGTGEIRPQQISQTFSTKQLLWIDRGAVWQQIDPNAHTYSNIALGAIIAYSALDTVLDGVREGPTAALADVVMYLEAASITLSATNLAKFAFRRPRPGAYIARTDFIANGGDYKAYENSVTDSSLSFFSGHTAEAAALSATATYIAFQRSPGTIKPWLTMAGGTALTAFVGYERVRSGAHFPTDVLAGALAGGAIGALVVHLHRADSLKQRPVWIGGSPMPGGGALTAGGTF